MLTRTVRVVTCETQIHIVLASSNTCTELQMTNLYNIKGEFRLASVTAHVRYADDFLSLKRQDSMKIYVVN